uniref:Uncharacterized protein n=1 Tax=Sphaerodactylus townsendi TaxID=933632 RepID=A0ACB8EI04_9SAUR
MTAPFPHKPSKPMLEKLCFTEPIKSLQGWGLPCNFGKPTSQHGVLIEEAQADMVFINLIGGTTNSPWSDDWTCHGHVLWRQSLRYASPRLRRAFSPFVHKFYFMIFQAYILLSNTNTQPLPPRLI